MPFPYTFPFEFDTSAVGPARALDRVTGLVHYWKAGPPVHETGVFQLGVIRDGLFSEYFSPVEMDKPTPTLQDRKPGRDVLATMVPTLREHLKWMSTHTIEEQRAIFGDRIITLKLWQEWVMSRRAMGQEIY